jgi:hypothetical protein
MATGSLASVDLVTLTAPGALRGSCKTVPTANLITQVLLTPVVTRESSVTDAQPQISTET